jgi:hypothetical protein
MSFLGKDVDVVKKSTPSNVPIIAFAYKSACMWYYVYFELVHCLFKIELLTNKVTDLTVKVHS